MFRSFKNIKGISLIELVIAITIMTLVLALGYSLYFFGTKNFRTVTTQAQIQQNARMIDEVIKKALRNSTKIVIGTAGQEADYDSYIKITNGYFIKNGQEITDKVVKDIIIKTEQVNQDGKNRYILYYEIICTIDVREFSIKNQILLNNIISSNEFITIGESNPNYPPSLNQYTLYYNKGDVSP